MIKRIITIILLFACTLLYALEWQRGTVLYVATPAKAERSVIEAKKVLAEYLQKSMDITLSDAKNNTADIHLGVTPETEKKDFYRKDLPAEAFIVAVRGKQLYIYGHDGKFTGTRYGVESFLEKELDITWIWPGVTGEDVPKKNGLNLADMTRMEKPGFMLRSGHFNKDPGFNDWAMHMRMSFTSRNQGYRFFTGHSWLYYYFRTPAAQKHPEYMALFAGSRRGPHLCTSSPEVRNYITEQLLAFAKKGKYDMASVSPSDGYGFCECAECRKLDPPGTDYNQQIPNLSNRHWDYAVDIARRVQKRSPGLKVNMFAYTAYQDAPTNLKEWPENLYTSFCFSKAYFIKPEIRRDWFKRFEAFRKIKARLIGREYWGMHYFMNLPYIYTREIARSMPELGRMGLYGMYGEMEGDFINNAPNYYLVARMMWDPSADGEKFLKRFYRAFGKAGAEIRAYYETFENALIEKESVFRGFAYRNMLQAWPDVFTEDVLTRAGKHIEKAKKLAADDPVYAEKVRRVALGYEYTVLRLRQLTALRTLGRHGDVICNMSLAGDIQEAEYYKIPLPPGTREFWASWDNAKRNLSPAERLQVLREADKYGDKFGRFLEAHADIFPGGMRREMHHESGLRPWRKQVKKLLKEAEKGKTK